jgi:hypothetical protein
MGRVVELTTVPTYTRGARSEECPLCGSGAALVIEPFEALSKKASEELTDEGNKLVRFVESDARTFEVRFAKQNSTPTKTQSGKRRSE